MAEQPESQELNAEEDAQLDTGAEQAQEDAVAGALEEPSLAQFEAELAEAQTALAEAKEQALRVAAEAQNVRRRAEQDVEKAHKFALDKFVNELLPVVDSLERAVDACQSDDAAVTAIREGVDMTLSMFTSALQKFNVAVLNPEGEPFDPQQHQAMSMVENPNLEPNTVMAVMQKGYTLNDRLIRPAMVMVSKAAPTDTPKIDEKA